MALKAIIVDFEDSFTYNIAADLLAIGIENRIISHANFSTIELEESSLIVLGPGPGHPSDYKEFLSYIENVQTKKYYWFGVCLGHQILGMLMGGELVPCKIIKHGVARKIEMSSWQDFSPYKAFNVQFYNSWNLQKGSMEASFILDEDRKNILAMRGENFLSYQFHPESVGTNFRDDFFRPLSEMVYNSWNDTYAKNRWFIR